jgi:transglutaminase-like putative cysteine protease/tetratricopeptide (TPR) repeat protein
MHNWAMTLTLLLLAPPLLAGETGFGPGDRYSSGTFGYEVQPPADFWVPWSALEEDYAHADAGYLGVKGYGAVVMPVCWQGERPSQLALVEVFLARFGEDYPTPFIHTETQVEKGSAIGNYLVGNEEADGRDYTYHFWIVANDSCAYTLAAWGPVDDPGTVGDLQALWHRLQLRASPAILENAGSGEEKARNAFFLGRIAAHYFEARSYRDAFRYLSQAADLDSGEPAHVINAIRVLVEIDAYREAYEWLQPRLARYGDDLAVRSWDAWLAYRNEDPDKALRVYEELFTEGYREDDEFALYVGLLAEREEWEQVEAVFAEYAAEGMTDPLRKLQADLHGRRGNYEEALGILDSLIEDRPFSADLVYAKIEVLDELDRPAELLQLADLLIEKNYRSLESYFYKGYAEYQLKSYVKARDSFNAALKYSPTSKVVQEYLSSINNILGEGENESISEALAAVSLPKDLQSLVDNAAFNETVDGYGAWYLNRITGYRYDGGETVSRTQVQQIKVQDAQGVANFSTLEFNFDPAFEQLYVNSLGVRNAAGEIIAEADPAAYYVTSTVDGYEASTEKTAHLPVPSLAPGAVIEVVVTTRISVDKGEFPLDIHYLSSSRPIGYSAVFVSGKHDSLQFRSFGIESPVTRGDSLVWETTNPIVYRWEPMQPYYDRMLPWVTIGTTSESWYQAGTEYLAMIEEKLETGRIADKAARLVEGIDDKRRKVEVISHFVQRELHYEAIEFGRRAYIPKTARETLRDRYGDCKDHAVLLVSMLNAVGVPAQLALVNMNQRVLPGLPNIDQFDHMIVSVPVDGSRLYIDSTDKDLKLGTTPPRYMAGNHALVLGEIPELLPIPDFAVGDSGLQVDREIERIADDQLRVTEIGVFSGYQAADMRGQLREIEASEMLGTMQRWVADRYSDAIVDDAFVDNVFDAGGELVVELQYRLPIETGSFELPGFFEATFLDFERLPERRFGFEIPVPITVSTVTTVRQSDASKLVAASKKPDSDESRFGSWRRKIDNGDEDWILSFEYTGGQHEYGPGDYVDFTDFHRRLVGAIEQPMVIE